MYIMYLLRFLLFFYYYFYYSSRCIFRDTDPFLSYMYSPQCFGSRCLVCMSNAAMEHSEVLGVQDLCLNICGHKFHIVLKVFRKPLKEVWALA